jgi:hypothetical protein
MADQPKHPRLENHNARVRRLARDYDAKFRPVVIVIASACCPAVGAAWHCSCRSAWRTA